MNKPLTIYLIAGEASGDFLGAQLMQALKRLGPVKFFGVGGERMQAEGMTSLFPYQDLSMLGFVEVLPHAIKVFARVNLAAQDIITKQPDVVVSIDVPGFSFRVAEKLRQEKFSGKLVHYVAPTVWAYKPQRAEVFAQLFDHILVLLPFEPPYFEKAGLACTFVGHAAVVESQAGNGAAFRTKYQIANDTPLFCILPGSRKGEIRRHMPIFARAIGMLATVYPKLAIVVAVPKHSMPLIAPYFENCPFRAVITANEQDKKDAIAASQLAIVKSGTVALEVAAAGTPMIVTYRVNPISAWALKRLILTPYANLINILLKKEVIPEFLQALCHPLLLASAGLQLLRDDAWKNRQKEQAKSALAQLIPANGQRPSDLAANVILRLATGAKP